MSDTQSGGAGGVPSTDTGDKIDRIREILLGGSLDEFGVRLGQLEARLQTIDGNLREEIERRYTSLDSNLTGQREQQSRAAVELSRKLADEVGALRNDLARVRSEVQSSVEAALAELDAKKLDRVALARILSDVSSRLTDEGAPADAESEPHD